MSESTLNRLRRQGLVIMAVGLIGLSGCASTGNVDMAALTAKVDAASADASAAKADAAAARATAADALRTANEAKAKADDTELELPELPSDVFDVDPFDQVIEIGDDLQKELDDDENSEPNAFEPVERHDDLQQIVGIDPLTEKALNDLGITSYAQLAKLKHHEIETIANALKIVPARIESDDWVGNARRQLEDVLEEL